MSFSHEPRGILFKILKFFLLKINFVNFLEPPAEHFTCPYSTGFLTRLVYGCKRTTKDLICWHSSLGELMSILMDLRRLQLGRSTTRHSQAGVRQATRAWSASFTTFRTVCIQSWRKKYSFLNLWRALPFFLHKTKCFKVLLSLKILSILNLFDYTLNLFFECLGRTNFFMLNNIKLCCSNLMLKIDALQYVPLLPDQCCLFLPDLRK